MVIEPSTNRRSLEPGALRKRESVKRLKDGLTQDRFILHYHPIVEAATGRPVSAEALLRWRHPETEGAGLSDLIVATEHSPVIYQLQRWSVQVACADSARWQHGTLPALCVNVNLSAREFERPRLPDRIRSFVRKAGGRPDMMRFEITETTAIRDPQAVARVLDVMRGSGHEIWLDDFGTGHSSLEWLWRLPVCGIKIPGTFVADVTTDATAAAILETVVALAHRLNMRVVAEGVETEAQKKWLVDAGCDELQGYLLYPTMTADELIARLTSA